MADELDDYLSEQMRDPIFRAAYDVACRRQRRPVTPFEILGAGMETFGVLVIRAGKALQRRCSQLVRRG